MRALLLSLLATAALAGPASAQRGFEVVDGPRADERRVALVIGNGGYRTAPLANPTGDAELVAASLRSVGFTVDERHDLDRQGMLRAIRDFGDRLKAGGVGLFFFAGHGLQRQGRSYLIPVEADIRVGSDVEIEAVDMARVLGRMEEAGNRLNLVFLDACRNNPVARSFRSPEAGLAAIDAPTGTLISYATGPGRVAVDGAERHSPYSQALAREVRTPGLKVEDVLKRVRVAVHDETAGAQVPWESSSLVGDFYFVPTGEEAAALGEAPPLDEPGGRRERPRLSSAGASTIGPTLTPTREVDTDAFVEMEAELQRHNLLAATAATVSVGGFVVAGSGVAMAALFASLWVLTGSSSSSVVASQLVGTYGSLLAVSAVTAVGGALVGAGFGAWWYLENDAAFETLAEIRKVDPDYGKAPPPRQQPQ